MTWRDSLSARTMLRVALVAPDGEALRPVLVEVADAGVIDFEDGRLPTTDPVGPAGAALEQRRREAGAESPSARGAAVPPPSLRRERPDVGELARSGRLSELLGEVEVERLAGSMVHHGPVAAIAGWCPAMAVEQVSARVAPTGGAVVRIRPRPGLVAPTLLPEGGVSGAFQPLVDTFATVPYRDINPSTVAGLSYVAMFGMMFGDVGHGLILMAAGLLLSRGRPRRLRGLRRLAPFVIAAGAASAVFGLAYGEAFGPTGLVPVLWIRPLDHTTALLAAAVAAGAGLIGISYVFGIVNRWREAGAVEALVAQTGVAGASLYAGLGLIAVGIVLHRHGWFWVVGAVLATTGFALAFGGSLSRAERGTGRVLQAFVEVFDTGLRIGANTISFTRLAAFGLTHAALGKIVWSGTTGLARHGAAMWLAAALLFVVGNAGAFVLEGLVAGIQALRLEYYEMFSRIFTTAGRPFRPWHVPLAGGNQEVAAKVTPLVSAALRTREVPC